MGDKIHSQKGKSPVPHLLSINVRYLVKDVGLHRNQGCWLRSRHSFKECVIAHWSSDPAPKISGAKTYYRSYGVIYDG